LQENQHVLSSRLKLLCVISSSRKCPVRLFQTRGLATAKLLSPNVLCVRGTTHDLLSVDERRRRRGPSETRCMSSGRYEGAWPDRDEKTKHASEFHHLPVRDFLSTQPSQSVPFIQSTVGGLGSARSRLYRGRPFGHLAPWSTQPSVVIPINCSLSTDTSGCSVMAMPGPTWSILGTPACHRCPLSQ